MSLEQWMRNQWLRATAPTLAEIMQLFAVVDREIRDASIPALSVDGRFMHAYDATLCLCTIALRANGYTVVKGQGHYKKTIEALPLSMGQQYAEIADYIEVASRKRGQAMYDRTDVVEEADANELLETTNVLRAAVAEWLKKVYPALVFKDFK